MNLELKIALIRQFGSQIRATRPLKIDEPRLSRLVQGHCDPNERERAILKKALGKDYFPNDVKESQANEKRGVVGILLDQNGCLISK